MNARIYHMNVLALASDKLNAIRYKESLKDEAVSIASKMDDVPDDEQKPDLTLRNALLFKNLLDIYIQLKLEEFRQAVYTEEKELSTDDHPTSFSFFIDEEIAVMDNVIEMVRKMMLIEGWTFECEFIMKQVDRYHCSLSVAGLQ